MPEKFDSATVLARKLADILVKGALYRVFTYEGKDCHRVNLSAQNMPRYGALPPQIKMFCAHVRCKQETWWEVNDGAVYFAAGFIQHRRYVCRNCGKNTVYYSLIWQE